MQEGDVSRGRLFFMQPISRDFYWRIVAREVTGAGIDLSKLPFYFEPQSTN